MGHKHCVHMLVITLIFRVFHGKDIITALWTPKSRKIKRLIHCPIHSEALLPILQEKYNGSLKCDRDILFNAAVWPEA